MPVEVASFLAVLARTSGFVALPSFPGLAQLPAPMRAVIALSLAVVLWPAAPAPRDWSGWSLGVEFLWGAIVGTIAAWLNEMLVLAMQIVGLQAGYTYASTVDPTTQADAAILQVFAQLMAGLLLFATGFDHALVRALAASLTRLPPGEAVWPAASGFALAASIVAWTARVLAEALTLALPVSGFLLLVDLAMGLLNRLHTQLQLLTLATPVKMLAALLLVVAVFGSAPSLYRKLSESAVRLIEERMIPIR